LRLMPQPAGAAPRLSQAMLLASFDIALRQMSFISRREANDWLLAFVDYSTRLGFAD